MKMYTNGSNARRAAKVAVDKFPDELKVAAPQRAPGITPMFYPAIAITAKDAERVKALTAELAEDYKVVDADAEDDDVPQTSQVVAGENLSTASVKPPKKGKKAKDAKPAKAKPSKAPKTNKNATAIAMMSAPGGATAKELEAKLGWLPHTLRGWVSHHNTDVRDGKKQGHLVETSRNNETKVTSYIIKAPSK